jgi:chemotaxis protein MotB
MEAQPPPAKSQPGGAPAWVITFADLMSLLLAFFVLLFSFSELDKQKFKELSGSMRDAFGVQREIRAKEPPKGINFVAREFSAGTPQPTPLNVLRQQTTNDFMRHLKVPKNHDSGRRKSGQQTVVEMVQDQLAMEIDSGILEVESEGEKVVIRIRENGSFPSASDRLESGFQPVVAKLAEVVRRVEGDIVVAGHTDSLPIRNARFRSNWELSSARAVTVLHSLLTASGARADRFEVEGHAATQPIDSNDTADGRARNRRVEIILVQGDDPEQTISVDDHSVGNEGEAQGGELTEQKLELDPEDVLQDDR